MLLAPPQDRLLSLCDVARRWQVSFSMACEVINRQRIPHFDKDGQVLVAESQVNRIIVRLDGSILTKLNA